MILLRKYGIAIIMAVIIFIPNVYAIKVNVNSGNGVSYSGDFRMDTSASIKDDILLSEGAIFQDTKASGKGQNVIAESIGGSGYNGANSLVTSGSFSIFSSSVITRDAGMRSQDVSANGDAAIAATAIGSTGTAVQQASVNNGALSSSQSLAMGDMAIAGQNTAIVGDSGTIDSSSISIGHQAKIVEGYFDGGGNLNAQMASMVSQGVNLDGSVMMNGLEAIDSEILEEMGLQEGGMEIEGLYLAQKGKIGSFGLIASNTKSVSLPRSGKNGGTSPTETATGKISNEGLNPEIVNAPPGDANSYVLNAGMINPQQPIQLYLRSDSFLKAEGLDPASAAISISNAADTWDYWTKPEKNNLFQPNVIIDVSKPADRKDGYSTHAFIPIDQTWYGYARTYYSKGAKYITETDVCYNTNRLWTTDWNLAQNDRAFLDLQSAALHELGHACGLRDLYSLPTGDMRMSDLYEIMNRYDGPQHSLGLGDISGIQAKYGS
jgi:hypothetical protein